MYCKMQLKHALCQVNKSKSRIAFHLSGKMVTIHLGNITVKAYVCKLVQFLFLSIIACHIFNLTNRHGISLTSRYIPTHLNVEANYLQWGSLVPEWHILPHIAQVVFQPWGQWEVDLLAFSHTNQY